MNILWIVNTIFPYPAEQFGLAKTSFGGWMISLFNKLKDNDGINIAIATIYNGKEIKKISNKNVTYYLLPCKDATKYCKSLEKKWEYVINDFKPEVIHIHGSEYAHALPLLYHENNIPKVLSIQGLIYVYEKVYYANISEREIIKNITFRDIIKMDSIIQQKKKFYRRGLNEKEIILRVNNIIGRTTWDYANTKAINNDIIYFKNNESLREAFYENRWNINGIERNTIFCSQANYPIKGLHFMIEALYIIKKQIPNIKLKIAGYNILNNKTIKDKLKRNGYSKYIESLIKKYNLQSNIEFTGLLNEKEMCEQYLKCNVFVQSSSIENSPNSLGEAMLLGVPCVASNVGGTSDMLLDKEEGYLYPYTDSNLLANYVIKILKDDNMSMKIGENANKKAEITHNIENNYKQLLQIYMELKKEKL